MCLDFMYLSHSVVDAPPVPVLFRHIRGIHGCCLPLSLPYLYPSTASGQLVDCSLLLFWQADDFAEAARLAFQLNQPGRLLRVITAAADKGPERCATVLRELVAGWEVTQLGTALKCIAQWNTNSRHCHSAHALLRAIMLQHSIEVSLACAHACSALRYEWALVSRLKVQPL